MADRERSGWLNFLASVGHGAQALQQLLEITPANTKTLEHIEGSILTVCLDDTAPLSRNDVRSHTAQEASTLS